MVDVEALRKSDFWNKKFRKLCEARDINKDGVITRGDYVYMIEKFTAATKNAKNIELFKSAMLSLCDKFGLADESVKLTYDEFRDRWLKAVEGNVKKHEETLKVMFTCLDDDGNGHIGLSEWKAFSEVVGGIPSEHAESTFKILDIDGDGKVTQEEFNAHNAEFFYSTENKLKSASFFETL